MILEEISMKEFEKKASKIKTVIIPVGSLEAHGPHLPLGTDTIEVYEMAKEVAQLVDVFVA
ncbi:MAG: creatininase family protein, partial [Thermodesulfobacteriota bacterium]